MLSLRGWHTNSVTTWGEMKEMGEKDEREDVSEEEEGEGRHGGVSVEAAIVAGSDRRKESKEEEEAESACRFLRKWSARRSTKGAKLSTPHNLK